MHTKRNVKDSVFVDLFSIPENILQLYQELNPGKEVSIEDIDVVTLDNILTVQETNDLGFIVKDEAIFLVEAQSTWSVNILVRILLYYALTIKRMIDEKHLNIYSAKPIPLLKPYFYLFYTVNQEVKDEICLSEEFFKHCSEKLGVEIRAKVIKDLNKREHISTQYILFTKIFDEQRSLYGYSMKTIEETLRICKTKGILLNYLETRESEVIEFMSFFLDQEKAMEFLIEEKQSEAIAMGKTQEKESRIQSIASTLFQQNNSIDSCIEQLKAFFPDVDSNAILDIAKKVYNS